MFDRRPAGRCISGLARALQTVVPEDIDMRFTPLTITVGAVLTLASIGGCATTRDRAEIDEDMIISGYIEGELMRNDYVSSMEVDVDVLDNVVTLRGQVPDEMAKQQAGAEAADVAEVVGVNNELRVIGVDREAFVDEDPDRIITMRIRRKLAMSGAVVGRHVDVDVFDGEVWLSGIVADNRERQAAASLAGDVKFVDAVHNEIRVLNESD